MSSSSASTTVGLGVGLAVGAAAVAAATRLWFYGAPAATHGKNHPAEWTLGGEDESLHDAGVPVRGGTAALREELQGLRIKELRDRAKQAAVDEAAIDDALDSDDPKTAMVDVLLQNMVYLETF